jgi:Tol biopolymer transport system component
MMDTRNLLLWLNLAVVGVLICGCGSSNASPPPPTRVAFLSYRTGDRDIWLMDANGANLFNLSNDPNGDSNPSWEPPNGGRLAFVSDRTGNWELYIINADGTGLQQLTNTPLDHEGSPDWSTTGKIVYVSGGGLRVYDLATSTITPLVTPGPVLGPKWSPDGTRILFSCDVSGDQDVFVVNPDGTGLTNLSNDPGALDVGPVWQPSGNQAAWVKAGRILVHDFVTNTQSIVTFSGNADGPAFSPDGSFLVYAENGDIWRLTWNGTIWTTPVQLTTTGNNFTPSWTADSSAIVFTSSRTGNGEIWRMAVDGSAQVNLTGDPAQDEGPVCQP